MFKAEIDADPGWAPGLLQAVAIMDHVQVNEDMAHLRIAHIREPRRRGVKRGKPGAFGYRRGSLY
jgi:hypothetical protein